MPYKMANVPHPVTSVPVSPRISPFIRKSPGMVCPLAKLGRVSPAVEHSRYRGPSPMELKCRSPIDPSVYSNLRNAPSPNSLEPSIHIHYFPSKRDRNMSPCFKTSNGVSETSFQNPPDVYYRSLPAMVGDHKFQNRQPLSVIETSKISKTSSLPSDTLRNSYHDVSSYDSFTCLPILHRGSPTQDHSFIYTMDNDSNYKLGRSSPSLDQGYHTLVSPSPGPSTPGPWGDYGALSPVSKGKKLNSKSSSTSSSPCNIDRLSDESMVKIFSYLDSNELCACAKVCKRWDNLAWEPKLWRVIKLSGENLSGDKAVRCVLRRLCGQGPAGACSVVEKVFLSDGARLTDKGLLHLARRCTELTHLQLQGCSAITNHAIFELVTKCPNLQHLDLTGCSQISCVSVIPGPESPPKLLLQYLDLTDCSALEDGGLKIIVHNCPQLVYLYLRRCVKITDIGIKFIPSFCSMLKEISVSDCNKVTDFGLHELAKLGAMLRYLSVAKCDRVSDAGLKVIARRCYKLRYLNARGCEAVSDDAITVLARSCPRLRALDIGKCDVSDAGLRELAQSCPNLKKLSLRNCDLVTDRGIQFIAYFCRGLQQLNIQDCQISIDGYRAVKKYCKRCVIEHTNPGFF